MTTAELEVCRERFEKYMKKPASLLTRRELGYEDFGINYHWEFWKDAWRFAKASGSQSTEREYQDEEFCEHCQADTPHTIYTTGHERDSSGDWQRCNVCRWTERGMNGYYIPPADWQEESDE
jgi:hypothetical protein